MISDSLQKFVDESKLWGLGGKSPDTTTGYPFTYMFLELLEYKWNCDFLPRSGISLGSELAKIIATDELLVANRELKELAGISKLELCGHTYRGSSSAYYSPLETWVHQNVGYVHGVLNWLVWLNGMSEYLLRQLVKKLNLDFNQRVEVLKHLVDKHKDLSWNKFATKKHGYRFWDFDLSVRLICNCDRAEWDDKGVSEVEKTIKESIAEQLDCYNAANFSFSALEPVLGDDAMKMIPIWEAVNQVKFKTEIDFCLEDLKNLRNAIVQSDVGGAMRKNEIKAELKFGHYTYFITVKDTGKGVVALGKTKDALGTAAVCGATAAAIGAVAACPILIAALPIAAILTGGFGRDTRR